METLEKEILRGGQFLVKESKCEDVFTPSNTLREYHMYLWSKHLVLPYSLLTYTRNLNPMHPKNHY